MPRVPDGRAVRPLPPVGRRVLAPFIAGGTAGAVVIAFGAGLRADIDTIGVGWSWAASAAQLTVAGFLLVLVARESIPAARLPVSWTVAAAVVGVALQILVAASLDATFPRPVPEGGEARMAWICATAIGAIALAPLLLAGWLVATGLPASGPLCAVAAGIASVVAADALWRLHCPFTSLEHVLLGHVAPAVPLVTVALVAVRTRVARRKSDRRKQTAGKDS